MDQLTRDDLFATMAVIGINVIRNPFYDDPDQWIIEFYEGRKPAITGIFRNTHELPNLDVVEAGTKSFDKYRATMKWIVISIHKLDQSGQLSLVYHRLHVWGGAFMSYPILAAKVIFTPKYHIALVGELRQEANALIKYIKDVHEKSSCG